jgi:hypothetical protein
MAYLGNCFTDNSGFDAETVEPADFSALPSGDYEVIISDSIWKTSKAGADYLSLTLQVVSQPHSGRYLWHSLNLNHANERPREIAQKELSAICRATNRMKIKDSSELHDIPVVVKVVYVPAEGQWSEKNQIKGWRKIGETAAVTHAAPPVAQSAARAAPRSAPPAAQAAAPKAAPPKAPPPAAPKSEKPWLNPKTAPATDDVAAEDIPF